MQDSQSLRLECLANKHLYWQALSAAVRHCTKDLLRTPGICERPSARVQF
jgi:hypothetical protein